MKIKNNPEEIKNEFLNIFINDYVRKFRVHNLDEFSVQITGLKKFVYKNDTVLDTLLAELKQSKINIEFNGDKERIKEIEITCKNITNNSIYNFNYQIQSLPNLIDLSSKTNIPVVAIITIRIIAQIICKIKILYKAIIIDLDDTLWKGTISEDGLGRIKENMINENGAPFIEFMRFVKSLGDELGIYLAICSRNDSELIESTLNDIDSSIFPLKNHIDCIIANHNDKSENIKIIAEQLSILPSSIVFIDDNQLIRDEVKNKLPEVLVPNWKTHSEIISQLIAGCIFERFELSINSQSRRKQYKILQAERNQNSLPELLIKVNDDNNHIQAKELYSKSNQFKLVSEEINYSNAKSLYFEVYRQNEENLGICSAITYTLSNNSKCVILNWAISCRYFEVGLEEFIILLLIEKMANKQICFACEKNDENKKVQEIINKYHGEIITDKGDSIPTDSDVFISQFNQDYHFVELLTNLRNSKKDFNVYWIETCSPYIEQLFKNTNLKLL
jgi:FkbH-like protein